MNGTNGVVGAWGVGLGGLGETAFGNGQGSSGLFDGMRFGCVFGCVPGTGSVMGHAAC